MCDKANRAEKPELQAAAREDATTATSQAAAAATATAKTATHKDAAHKDTDSKKAQVKPQGATRKGDDSKKAQVVDPEFARAENEDDDGYDPYSDRRPVSEPLFERDPWS